MNWALLQNSLIVASAVTVAGLTAGTIVALCAAALERPWRTWLLGAAIVTFALPPFLVTSCWLNLLGQTGQWRDWFPLNIYSLPGTVWVLTLLLWPVSAILIWADWRRLSSAHLESDAALRGAAFFRWLLLPLARSGMVQAAVLTFVLALNHFTVPAILQTKVFPAEVWVSFNTTLDYATALRIGWPLIVVPILLVIWLARRDVAWSGFRGAAPAASFRRHLGSGWIVLCGAITLALVVASLGVPVQELLLSRRTWSELPAALAAGSAAFGNSALFAAAGATACVVLGLLLWRWKWPAGFWVAFLLPGILVGVTLSFVLNRPFLYAVYQSVAIVFVGLALRYGIIGWKAVRHALGSVDPDLTATAIVNDGARRWSLLRHVWWPQAGPQILGAWYLIYLFCLWEVETLIFIIPPGRETLALRIFNLLHYGHNAQVYALCLALIGLALAPLLIWWIAQKIQWRRCAAGLTVCGAAGICAGCGPALKQNETSLRSELFEKVQVIGARGTALGQFNKPRSLATDRNDNVYVVDMTGRVQKFSPEGVFLASWQMPETDKGKPKGMGRDLDGNIVVIEPHYARVNHFTPEGKLVAQWGVYGTNTGELTLPRAIAVNAQGELFVSEYTRAERVQKFSAYGKEFLLAFGRSGSGPGEFNRPEGVAVDARGRIYVADSCNHRIQIFSPEGQPLASYGRAGTGLGELSYPYDIQVDADGLQYVCEFGNSRVQIFDSSNQPLEIIGGMGSEPGRFSNPWSLALDSKGNVYVADSRNHRVQKLIRRSEHAVAKAQRTGGGKS